MMFRTFSPELVDVIVNHPSVRPTAELGEHRLSSAAVLADPRNYALIGTGGLVLFQQEAPRHFLGHIYAVEGSRGGGALALGQAALAVLFGRYDGLRCRAAVPLALRPARWLVRRLGFATLGVDPYEQVEHFIMEAAAWQQ